MSPSAAPPSAAGDDRLAAVYQLKIHLLGINPRIGQVQGEGLHRRMGVMIVLKYNRRRVGIGLQELAAAQQAR